MCACVVSVHISKFVFAKGHQGMRGERQATKVVRDKRQATKVVRDKQQATKFVRDKRQATKVVRDKRQSRSHIYIIIALSYWLLNVILFTYRSVFWQFHR